MLAHYGKQCICCGEAHEEFLTIDHAHGGGSRHRQELRAEGGAVYKLYEWLVENGFPDGYQLLCFNCNIAKAQHGQCPHEREKMVNTRGIANEQGEWAQERLSRVHRFAAPLIYLSPGEIV